MHVRKDVWNMDFGKGVDKERLELLFLHPLPTPILALRPPVIDLCAFHRVERPEDGLLERVLICYS